MNSYQAADRIDYNRAFKENVEGRLEARFRLDPDGEPMYEPDDDDKRRRHYMIDVFLVTPRAKEIKAVTFYMDDPSFGDPKGYSDDADNQFREEIASYGDVEIDVTVKMREHGYKQRAWLSNMLENGHAEDMNRAIRAALERIKVS